MSDSHNFTTQVELERLAERFEADWRLHGKQASIAEVLSAASGEHQASLFRTLLELDLDYRRRAGESPSLAAYAADFPEYASIIRDAFAAPVAGDTPPYEGSQSILEGPGSIVGSYKLLQVIGEGGFGIVYMAEQTIPVRRKVALKIIKPGMDTKEVIARFEAERQALALMDHPNIAHVFDGGTTRGQRPYFVMELVKGVPITEYCDKNHSPTHERLRLFTTTCQAVQHAHQKGVIHRDLKPNNVLVTLHDGQPIVKVIDFGVAKAINQQLTERTLFTAYGQMVGTPQYMSPEQAEMSGLDVDTRSDVYSLGVILYELLTGTTPTDAIRLRTAGYVEMQRIIQEEHSPKPSMRLSTLGEKLAVIASNRSVSPEQLHRQLRGDLDWIVMKSLEKDRSRRYDSATDMMRDVERFVAGEPVTAGPPSRIYRIRKFVGRNKLATAFAITVCLTVLLGLLGTTTGLTLARSEAREAQESRRVAVERATEAEFERAQAQAQRTRAQEVSDSLARRLYAADMNNAMTAWEKNDLVNMQSLISKYETSELCRWEWHFLKNLLFHTQDAKYDFPPTKPLRVVLSPTGDTIVSLQSRHAVMAVHHPPSRESRVFEPLIDGVFHFTYASFSPDGTLLAHPNGAFSKLMIRDAASLEISDVVDLNSLGIADPYISAASFTTDGSSVVMAVKDHGLVTYMVESGQLRNLLEMPGLGRYVSLAFSDDGTFLAVSRNPVVVLKWPSGEKLYELSGHTREVTSLRFVQQDEWLLTASRDRTIIAWNTNTGERMRTLGPFDSQVRQLAYHAQSARIAAGFRNRTVRVWSLPGFSEIDEIRGYNGLYAVEFDRQGRLLYGSHGGGIRFREARSSATSHRIDCGGYVTDLRYSSCGKYLACITNRIDASNPEQGRQVVILYELLKGGHRQIDVPGILRNASAIATNSQGSESLLAMARQGSAGLQIVDLATHRVSMNMEPIGDGEISAIAFRNDGRSLVYGLTDGRLAELRFGENPVHQFLPHEHGASITELQFFADGRLVSGAGDGSIHVWKEGVCDWTYEVSQGWIKGLDTEGRQLAFGLFGAADRDLNRIFVVDASRDVKGFYGHTFSIHDVAFIEDGQTLITLGGDRTLKLWDRDTLEQRLAIHGAEIFSAFAVSPDERAIAAGTREGTIFLFHR